jgi:hypothetical protein
MGYALPPHDCPSPDGPLVRVVPAGTVWWRIHGSSPALSFRGTGAEARRTDPRTHGEEGRFDCQRGEYGYVYAGATKKVTIAEAFLRGTATKNPAARFLRRARLKDRVLSCIELVADLPLVDLCGAAGLGRIGQDARLTACDEVHYPITQQWATAIRRWAPNAAGIVWMSKRDNVREAAVLFADRVPAGALSGREVRALDSPLGLALVTKVLAEFNLTIA